MISAVVPRSVHSSSGTSVRHTGDVNAVVEALQIGALALMVVGLLVTLVVVWRKDHENILDVPSIGSLMRVRA